MTFLLRVFAPSLILGCLIGCPSRPSRSGPTAEQLFDGASAAATALELDRALETLERSFRSGFEHPSRALWEPGLEALRRNPTSRARLRTLLEQHARESVVRVTPATEPGIPLTLRVTVVDAVMGAPIPGVLFSIVHTDREGLYLTDSRSWNPRLFACGVTDEEGRVEFQTIRPGYYPPGVEMNAPAHVHFEARREGYRPFGSEIWFDDDPRATSEAIDVTGDAGAQVAHTIPSSGGFRAEVSIAVVPLSPSIVPSTR